METALGRGGAGGLGGHHRRRAVAGQPRAGRDAAAARPRPGRALPAVHVRDLAPGRGEGVRPGVRLRGGQRGPGTAPDARQPPVHRHPRDGRHPARAHRHRRHDRPPGRGHDALRGVRRSRPLAPGRLRPLRAAPPRRPERRAARPQDRLLPRRPVRDRPHHRPSERAAGAPDHRLLRALQPQRAHGRPGDVRGVGRQLHRPPRGSVDRRDRSGRGGLPADPQGQRRRQLKEVSTANNAASVLFRLAWPLGTDAKPPVAVLARCADSDTCAEAPAVGGTGQASRLDPACRRCCPRPRARLGPGSRG